MSKRRIFWLALACTTMAAAIVACLLWPPRSPGAATTASFVGTPSCANCHQEQFANWQQSHHRHAMEVADATSVLGDFNEVKFTYFGSTSRFFTRDGQYFVETDNARGELETFRIAYTFGWTPLQQYLIEFPDGRMQALGIVWDSRPAADGGQRWYHLYPEEKVTHDDPLHWTGAFQNWNSRCAACHSTNLVRNYAQEANRYNTTWQDVNVGCEACHGPGSRHVEWAGSPGRSQDNGLTTDVRRLWTPAVGKQPIPRHGDTAMSGQLQACAGCHSRRAELQHPDVAASFFDNYTLSPLLDGLYFSDGQMRDEVYETGSFLQSRMHQNHVSCTNCHEPHSGSLRVQGNGLCLQCHQAPRFSTAEHSFHKPDTPGAQCVNCHMPPRTYMGVDVRRDHSFRIPDPAHSLKSGTPNACTQCHTNRNDRWAADFLAKRTGTTGPRYPHAELLAAARRNDPAIAPELLAYAGNAGNPPVLRSIALMESGRFPGPQQSDTVRAALKSGDPLVRLGAASALDSMDAGQRLALLGPLLEDPVKSVRHAVARQLVDIPLAQAPQELRTRLGRLFDEYRNTLQHNADMPESMSDLGLFLGAQGDTEAAEKALLHARRLSPRYLAAMLNLADLHRARNRDDLGEPILLEALAEYPESGDAHHMLGLLYVRTGRTSQSVSLLRKASELAPDNPQYALVHALALIETGDRPRGLAILATAQRRFPHDTQIRLALEAHQNANRN
jgi:predicted CXXCH cytochrome family protein